MDSSVNKLRGGYYTPHKIAEFVAKWSIRSPEDKILEPSCGDGHFLKEAYEILSLKGATSISIKENLLGVELYEEEAAKAEKTGATIINEDFFSYYSKHIKGKKSFQAVIGNPPFIRYQNFDEKYRKCAFDLVKELGIELNRLSNIWLPFLILSRECLDECNGRLGMVIPAELFQVDYASEIRKYLSEKFEHLIIITFKKLLFEDAQQEVVLLLGECKSERKGIEVFELDNGDSLDKFSIDASQMEIKELDHTTEKWTKYYLSKQELTLLREVENKQELILTTKLFDVNVGIVSGQNKFFVIDQETVIKNNLQNSVQPIIGRAEQLKGVCLQESDLVELKEQNKKVYMFTPSNDDYDKLTGDEQKYIKWGEKQKYHEGYKCRIRKKWYIVPQTWKPDAFMLRQINKVPKIVINETSATNTDTLHKIRFLDGVNGHYVAAAMLNSFTFAQCEITGRSYGGGVMTFEPGEVRKLKIPMRGSEQLDLDYIDELMRRKEIYKILDYTDKILLIDGMGLTKEEVKLLRGIWEKLSERRVSRKKGMGVVKSL